MKIKIVSDGTGIGTKLFDLETGKELELPITAITWMIDTQNLATAILVVCPTEIEAVADATVEKEPIDTQRDPAKNKILFAEKPAEVNPFDMKGCSTCGKPMHKHTKQCPWCFSFQ